MLSIRQFSLRHVSDICYRHVTDMLPTCYRHVTDMFPTFYTDIYTDIITATLPPLPPTFLPQEKIFAKNPPTLPIYNKVGRERGKEGKGGQKGGKREVFYKKIGFCKFLLGLYKRILEKKVYICNIRIRNR